jgi:hypothetical protein
MPVPPVLMQPPPRHPAVYVNGVGLGLGQRKG